MATVNQEEMFKFLDELQANGIINMFGAGAYLQDEYKIDRHQAKDIVLAWMKSKR
jgi:hypothetical protein